MSTKLKLILSISLFLLIIGILSNDILGIQVFYPLQLADQLRAFLSNGPQLSAEDYKDGTIILVKPRATGVGEGRAEAGDIVEVRDGAELYERFGNGSFLGKGEMTRLLPFYIDRKLADEEKAYLTEPDTTKHRKVGLDFTKFLSDSELSQARSFYGIDRIPTVELTDIEKKGDKVSVVELSPSFVWKEKYNLNQMFYTANAQTASTSIIDPDNGAGTDYTSLNAWEDAMEGNLVIQNEVAVATCRSTGGSADETSVTIDGWTTDATHYIKIWTDPVEGYRHDGKWDETAYRLEVSNDECLYILEDYVRVDGIQAKMTVIPDNETKAIRFLLQNADNDLRVSNCIVRGNCSGTGSGIGIVTEDADINLKVWNCLIYDFISGNDTGFMGMYDGGANAFYVYNCTIHNCGKGFFNVDDGIYNTAVFDCNDDFDDCAIADYCASDDGDGDHSVQPGNWSSVFLDYENGDFHLTASADLKDAGTDLSDTFSDDIDGETRTGTWDIGADEKKSSTVANAPQTNFMTDGLVGYWSFDGQDMDWGSTTAEVLDRSGNSNNGNAVNGPTPTIGISGQALEFDGVDDYVTIPNDSSIAIVTSTLSFWMRSVPLVNSFPLTHGRSVNNGWYIKHTEHVPNGAISIKTNDGTNSEQDVSNYVFPHNQWIHVAVVLDTDNVDYYLNGAFESHDDITIDWIAPTQPLVFGSYYDGAYKYPYQGSLDEVRVYNRALSAGEIQELYEHGARRMKVNAPQVNKLTDGLVGHWTFDGPDLDGVTAYDRSGEGNNGTLTNGPTPAIGISGQGLEFDGVDDYVDINTDITDGLSEITVCAWAKADVANIGDSEYIAGEGLGAVLYRMSTEVFNFSTYNDETIVAAVSDTAYADTDWHYVCGTYDGAYVDLFVDGVDDESATNELTGTIRTNALDFYIGSNCYGSLNWDGIIDEVRVYNRALGADEIGELYRAGARRYKIKN